MASNGDDFVTYAIFSEEWDLPKAWLSNGDDFVTYVIFSEECILLKACVSDSVHYVILVIISEEAFAMSKCLSHLHKLCVPLWASNTVIFIRWRDLFEEFVILNKNFQQKC